MAGFGPYLPEGFPLGAPKGLLDPAAFNALRLLEGQWLAQEALPAFRTDSKFLDALGNAADFRLFPDLEVLPGISRIFEDWPHISSVFSQTLAVHDLVEALVEQDRAP